MKGWLLESDPDVPQLIWLWRKGSIENGWEICFIKRPNVGWEEAKGPTHHAPWRIPKQPGEQASIWREPTEIELLEILL